MAKKLFILGIGGTGMRCIESLIHLCAMGMFDDTDLHLLALDTDKNNGNFSRLKAVKDAYLGAKGLEESTRSALTDTFFSANLKYCEFSPDYETKSSFKDIFSYSDTHYKHPEHTALADLMLSNPVKEFNLRHGYRAQTHLGSMMMYHSIMEAAEAQGTSFHKFLEELIATAANGNPRIFILGSVFGGTGASSIPIIPQALSDAVAHISKGSVDLLKQAYFSSTLLTAYFNFTLPSGDEIAAQKVIATSDKFALNSQIAMMFYDGDTTVKSTYQRFYMIGTPGLDWNPMVGKESRKTITGGNNQENDSHYIELLAASAALDFARAREEELRALKEDGNPKYLYRSIEEDGVLEFQDFVEQSIAEEFARKMGMLFVMSILTNGKSDFVASVQGGLQKEFIEYSNINPEQVNCLKRYFALLHLYPDENGNLKEGWLRQLHRSAGAGDKFLFRAQMFSPASVKDYDKLKYHKELYRPTGTGKDNSFSTGLLGSQFDSFKKAIIAVSKRGTPPIQNRGEQLYKMIYDALMSLYKFNN